MPALLATGFAATVVWLGRVANRCNGLTSTPVDQMWFGFDGPEGDAHGGLTRASCSRVQQQYPRGTTIRNTRQVTVVSQEELALIAARMGLDALAPDLLGATVVLAGLPDLTHLPPSSRLQAPGGATLVVGMENRPCTLVSQVIEARHPGCGARFKPAAKARRGVTAWVERVGVIRLGDSLRLHIPDQRAWAGLQGAALIPNC